MCSSDLGTPTHLGLEQFNAMTGARVTGVNYKGAGPAVAALLANEMQVMFVSMPTVTQHIQSGRVRALAVTGEQRSAALPDVPTAMESGFPDVIAEGFQGFFGWRDMASALRDQIAADVRAVAPELPADRLVSLGQVVRVGSTADFAAMIADQKNRVAAVVKAGGVKAKP